MHPNPQNWGPRTILEGDFSQTNASQSGKGWPVRVRLQLRQQAICGCLLLFKLVLVLMSDIGSQFEVHSSLTFANDFCQGQVYKLRDFACVPSSGTTKPGPHGWGWTLQFDEIRDSMWFVIFSLEGSRLWAEYGTHHLEIRLPRRGLADFSWKQVNFPGLWKPLRHQTGSNFKIDIHFLEDMITTTQD